MDSNPLKLSNLFSNLDKFALFCSKVTPKLIPIINILELDIIRKQFEPFLKSILNNFEPLCDSKLFDYPDDIKTALKFQLHNKESFQKVLNKLLTEENKQLFLEYCKTHESLHSLLNKISNYPEIRSSYFTIQKIGSNVTRKNAKISGSKIETDNEYYLEFGEINVWYKINNEIVDSLIEGKKIIIEDQKHNLYEININELYKEDNFQDLKN